MPINNEEILFRTKNWIEQVVIGLNLCPFAKSVHVQNQIRYQVSDAQSEEQLVADLNAELKYLIAADPRETETTLLIHPKSLNDFLDYNDFLSVADQVLAKLQLVGEIQIASFHPQYQFAGTQPEDAENYTNRSPYPMLHLLRETSIEKAISGYSQASEIPARNIQLLRKMSKASLEKIRSHSQ